MKKKNRLKLRRGLLRALKAQSVDLVPKLRSIPQTIGRRQTLPARPWEEFTPKYRDREPVPGSRHYLLEERDRARHHTWVGARLGSASRGALGMLLMMMMAGRSDTER